MPRTTNHHPIETPTERLALEATAKPRWVRIDGQIGLHIGYLRKPGENVGRWIARRGKGNGSQDYEQQRIGLANDLPKQRSDNANVFDYTDALARVRLVFTEPSRGRGAGLSIDEAIEVYIELKKLGPEKADDVRRRLTTDIPEKLRRTAVRALTDEDIANWQTGLKLAMLARKAARLKKADRDEPQDERERKAEASVTRVWKTFKAVLNKAADRYKLNDRAWRRNPGYGDRDRPRDVHLTWDEIQHFIDTNVAHDANLTAIAIAGAFTGARWGELRKLRVEHFDTRGGATLHFIKGKTKARTISLSPEAAAFFAKYTINRPRTDPIFIKETGKAWGKSCHSRRFKAMVARAGFPEDMVFYSLRHSYISRALEQPGCDLKKLADHCGTSVFMIMKHYAKSFAAQRAAHVVLTTPKLGVADIAVALKKRKAA